MRMVWTARVCSAGNWRIVGEQDEMGPRKRREPSIATKEMLNVGSWRAVVNRFFPRTGIDRGSADVFDVTGNSVIGDVTQAVERPVIMPARIAVAVKRFGNNCSGHIRVTPHFKVCGRGIKRG